MLLSHYGTARCTSAPSPSPGAPPELPAATFPNPRLYTVFISQSKQGLGASPSRGSQSPTASGPWPREPDRFLLRARVVGAKFMMANEKRAGSGSQEPRGAGGSLSLSIW